MLGAICGDIIGSTYEHHPVSTYDFELFPAGSHFTDDSVCTIAIADALINKKDLAETLASWCLKYPHAGYGQCFGEWIYLSAQERQPYNSCGNGSAMRVSAVGWLYPTLEETLTVAERTAAITHNHPEGIKGAQAVAAAIYLARTGTDKQGIRKYIINACHYDLFRSYEEVRKDYQPEITCQESVPEALLCFLESTDYEDSIRKAVYLKGDADTQACIAGAIAEAYYHGVPEKSASQTLQLLPAEFLEVYQQFNKFKL